MAVSLVLAAPSLQAHATGYQFTFAGSGVSGTVDLTYGTATDAKYPQAFELTGASGTFTDTNAGIVNASITGLEAIRRAAPEPTNLLAPNDFSRFAIASGSAEGGLTYDNLFYPGGSPETASTYPFHGGFTDIYGLLFTIGDGRIVDFWSNGVTPGNVFPDYGVAVATHAMSLDYVSGGITPTPEPGTFYLLGTGLLAAFFLGRRSLLVTRL